MTEYIFTNVAKSTLATAIGTSDVSLSVAAGEGALFPSPAAGQAFHVIVFDSSNYEWMVCTGRSTDTLTVTRSGSPKAFSSGASIHHRINADALNNFLQKGTERTVTADPNGSAAEYSHEVVYDSVAGIFYQHISGTTWVALNS